MVLPEALYRSASASTLLTALPRIYEQTALDAKRQPADAGALFIQEALSGSKKGSATLHVDPANTAAVLLYKSLSFELDGVLQDYYSASKPAHKLARQLQQ